MTEYNMSLTQVEVLRTPLVSVKFDLQIKQALDLSDWSSSRSIALTKGPSPRRLMTRITRVER